MDCIDITYGDYTAKLLPVLCENSYDGIPQGAKPAILILPGGGYAFTSEREAKPVARRFNTLGFHCFVLHYSVTPAHYPTQLVQAAMAMQYIRKNAAEFNIIPNSISVCGFSAGGHLAASLSTLYDSEPVRAACPDTSLCRPDAQVLAYPVILWGEFTNVYTFEHLLGDAPCEQYAALSLEKHITPNTPRAFIWHTADDDVVPIENSIETAATLRKNGVSFELHIYEHGSHGLSLCTDVTNPDCPDCAGWVELASAFLKRN